MRKSGTNFFTVNIVKDDSYIGYIERDDGNSVLSLFDS